MLDPSYVMYVVSDVCNVFLMLNLCVYIEILGLQRIYHKNKIPVYKYDS